MIKFSYDQQNYIDSALDKNIYLRACPGAGKTEVVATKVALAIKNWTQFPSGMAVLSFSRSATSELKDRIAKVRRGSTNVYPHVVGTVDSFILKNIVTPLAHFVTGFAGRDGDYSIRVVGPEALSFYRTKYAIEHQHIAANRFDWDAVENRFLFWHSSDAARRKLNSIILQDWQINDLNNTKRRFYAAGYSTYRDVERLAIQILSNPKYKERVEFLVARFPFIVIDECQDLSAEQITIFEHLAALGVRFHLVGDLDQAIYGFRNCSPKAVENFIARIGCLEMPLAENHRSGQLIVDLHGRLVNAKDVQGRANYAPVTCYLIEYKKCPSEVLVPFDVLAMGHTSSVIVARGHAMLKRLRGREEEQTAVQMLALAIATFAKQSAGSLHTSLLTFASYLAENCMNCETLDRDFFFRPVVIESAEVWHRFLSDCLGILVNRGLDKQDMTWQQWCKALKMALPSLGAIECIEKMCLEIRTTMQGKKHASPKKMGHLCVAVAKNDVEERENRRLATIHEVKGETHDLTMLVSSSKQGGDSNWKEWMGNPLSEAARMAYVASSRPRHILVWAVKELKASERKKLTELGFSAYQY